MPSSTGILLAAGLSRRMGGRNKLLAPVAGRPMVRHVARVYLAALDGPLTVVTGHEATAVRAALAGLAVRFAHNERFARGQPGSVAAGLAAAAPADHLLIGLGDQPLLRPDDLAALIAAHRAGDPGKITIPRRDGARGNPILVPSQRRADLTSDPARPGCMRFTRDHPEHVQFADLPAPGFYADVDTPADYAALSPALNEATQ